MLILGLSPRADVDRRRDDVLRRLSFLFLHLHTNYRCGSLYVGPDSVRVFFMLLHWDLFNLVLPIVYYT